MSSLDVTYIGQMDKRIEIFKLTDVYNDIREIKQTEVLFLECWASRKDLKTPNSESEYVEGKIIHVQKDCFTIRYRKEISDNGNKMILKFEEKKYRISHVEQIGRKKHLRLYVDNYE